MSTNTIGYSTPGFVPGVAHNFPGSQQPVIAKGFKKRFRDKSILPYITNNTYEGTFKHQGTEVQIPILPIIHTYRVKPGDKVKYQTPKSTLERFYIGRERAFGLHIEDEDKLFSRFDLESPILAEASKQMADDVEFEFFNDIISKCASYNTGSNAGWMSKDVNLGSATNPVTLKKTAAEATAAGMAAAPDYFVEGVNALQQYPEAGEANFKIVASVPVLSRLQTSELRQADVMGDAKSTIRGNVRMLGRLGDSDIIANNRMPVYKDASGANVYPVLFVDKSAISFVQEVSLRDTGMKDIDYWGTFNRTKLIYDWFLLYPERFGVGYVKL
jgi:hypothetical protein